MAGTVYTCLHTNQSRSYLNHLVLLTPNNAVLTEHFGNHCYILLSPNNAVLTEHVGNHCYILLTSNNGVRTEVEKLVD